MAMCAAGPPKAITPSFTNSPATSPRRALRPGRAASTLGPPVTPATVAGRDRVGRAHAARYWRPWPPETLDRPRRSPRLALDAVADDRFVSARPTEGPHVFGGLLIGQALRAAALTVDRHQPARSLHASFLVAGTGGEPLRFEVERTRDGASFATRRVVVRQERGTVLVLTADFHPRRRASSTSATRRPGCRVPTGWRRAVTTTPTSSRAT